MNFFLDEITPSTKTLKIEGEAFHHFKNVSRGKVDSVVKVFNGKGLILDGTVIEMTKKSLMVEVKSFQEYEFVSKKKLILGIPKKEYFESILKSCTQIGIQEIFLVPTKFSPWKFKENPRFQKILESSLLQSENPFIPRYKLLDGIESLKSFEDTIFAFSTEVKDFEPIKEEGKCQYFLIGPEGGFHLDEIEMLKTIKNITLLKLPTPIMKAETAVVYAAGFLR